MKRKDLNQLLSHIKEQLFLSNPEKRKNILSLLEGSRFEEINEKTSTMIISSESKFAKDILNLSEFKEEFNKNAANILNTNYEVAFVSREEWDSRNVEETTEEIKLMTAKSDSLRGDFTLDNFLASGKGENKMVKQAALSVALKPGSFTPFFIYGGSGLGKTHLLHAIGNKIKETYPNFNIKYLQSKDFKDLVYDTEKISTSHVKKITEEYLSYDVLLVDDIQMLQTLNKAKEVFFNILSSYLIANKQIVITSDQYPEEMSGFEDRFITRFKGGVVFSVTPPDIETAKLILLQKLERKEEAGGIKLSDPALEFIATHFGSNVRELEGSLGKIIFWSIVNDRENTEYGYEDMLEIFDGMSQSNGVTMQSIVTKISKHYQVNMSEVLGKSRKADIAFPRHLCIYFCRTLLDVPLMDIGRYFGRDHSTILSSIRKIEKDHVENQELSKVIYELRKKITSN